MLYRLYDYVSSHFNTVYKYYYDIYILYIIVSETITITITIIMIIIYMLNILCICNRTLISHNYWGSSQTGRCWTTGRGSL